MPISKKKLRSVLEQSLEKYKQEKYNDYEYGDPSETAKNVKRMVDEFLDEVDRELDNAGEYIRPGLKKATKNYIDKKFNQEI